MEDTGRQKAQRPESRPHSGHRKSVEGVLAGHRVLLLKPMDHCCLYCMGEYGQCPELSSSLPSRWRQCPCLYDTPSICWNFGLGVQPSGLRRGIPRVNV